jgi:hypothetical protein
MKKISRRTLVKIGASLFSFVPITKSLIEATETKAYHPCEEPLNCVYINTVCYIHPNAACQGLFRFGAGYNIYNCYDRHDGSFCRQDAIYRGSCFELC